MTTTLVLVIGALFVAGIYLYNRLVRAGNRVSNAWSDIDVQLQRRHDLVPRLVEAVKQYAGYEKATLEAVTELRAQALETKRIDDLGDVEEALEAGMHKLIVLAEDYPDLKADGNFLQLQNELVETEDFLQFARRYYNASVRDYNTMTETVPSNLVAGLFRFRERPFFQKASDEVARAPRVSLGAAE